MNSLKIRNRSVFYTAGIFLILLIAQVIMYGNFFNELKKDTEVINDLSRVRGSIQRYTKLELSGVSGTKIDGVDLESYIDGVIERHMGASHGNDLTGISELNDIETLSFKWGELKSLIRDYHADPSKEISLAVLSKSEECWSVADTSVIRQQYIVNKTASYYKYFTLTFGINLLVIVITLILFKKFIYNTLASSAINDSLTKVFNKGYFNEYLEHEIARAVRMHKTFSLIMLDIDHFKNVNDTYGHRRGDYALQTLADVVRKCKRNADVLARIGGEEFIVLLPDTSLSDAIQLAERMRKSVESFVFEEIGRMTISLGVTEFLMTDQKEDILKRVDSALYLAKGNGRNRCEVIEGEEKS